MINNLSQLQIFKLQTYMNENRATLCGRTIADVQLTVQFAMGFNINKSRIIETAKMFNMPFSKVQGNRKSTTNTELDKLRSQVKILAIAIKEIYEDCSMKSRQDILDMANCRRAKRRVNEQKRPENERLL